MADAQTVYLMAGIPGRLPQLANGRMHWRKRAELVRKTKARAYWQMLDRRNTQRGPAVTWPVRLSITVHVCGRLYDRDNLYANVKPVVDGAKQAKWIVDDSPEWCELEVAQQRVAHRIEERVEIGVAW